ncbi:hypothetical protein [Moorena sp. SIO4A1]|nr:hypothetical protein [Moorena sp. SIO4A1]
MSPSVEACATLLEVLLANALRARYLRCYQRSAISATDGAT